MMRIYSLMALLVGSSVSMLLSAQGFYRTYGQPGRTEFGTTLFQASNGAIYLGGAVNDSAMIQRLDGDGHVLWTRTFKPSGQQPKQVVDIQESPDGSIIGCGLGISGQGLLREGFHFRLDESGEFMWVRSWNAGTIYIKSIRPISENEYLLIGCDYDMSATTYADILLARIDASTGSIVWQSPRMDLFSDVPYIDDSYGATILNGSMYMTGRVFTSGSLLSGCRVNVSKFHLSGQLEWTKYLMFQSTEDRRMYGSDLISYDDSLTVYWLGDVTGSTSNWLLGVTRLDSTGTVAWSRAYNVQGSVAELADKIVATDFGYAMTARYSVGQQQRILLMGIDRSGNVLWTRSHGSLDQVHHPEFQYGRNLIALDDGLLYTGGIVAQGDVYLLLVRTMNDGTLECEESSGLSVVTSVLPEASFLSSSASTNVEFFLQAQSVSPVSTVLDDPCVGPGSLLGPDIVTCDTVLFDASVNGASYLWSNGSTGSTLMVSDPGVYWVRVIIGCCVWSDTVTVQQGDGPSWFDIGPDTLICAGEILDLSIPDQGYPILWSTGSTTTSIQVDAPGTYWVQVGSDSCMASDTITVTLVAPPVVELGPDTLVCGEEPLLLVADLPDGTGTIWSDGSTGPTLSVSLSGTYGLVATNACGSGQDSVIITFAEPFAMPGDRTICEDELAWFDLEGTVASIVWSDGSTTFSVGFSVGEHGFEAIDLQGCERTGTVAVFAADELDAFAKQPNVFTPNGDGENDLFLVPFVAPEWFRMEIFNRWGQLLFVTEQHARGWDGTHSGVPVSEGTYFYVLRYRSVCGSGELKEVGGHITLLR